MSNKLGHIAFIMDGNNRWSIKRELSKYDSYKRGASKLVSLSNYIFKYTETNTISAFALSKDNLQRSSKILNVIKKILFESLTQFENNKRNYDLVFIGNFNFLEDKIKKKIYSINKKQFFKKKLLIYLNYGGREDIQQAAKKFNNKNNFENNLLTSKYSEPDLLIRTGGYRRISNFLLYQLAFTELFFLNKLWPDLSNADIKKIISQFNKIERKFGK